MVEGCKRVQQRENEADAIAGEVQLGVRRTFITPFDRSDIGDLISLMDDSIDQMQKTAKAITLFEVREFSPTMRELGAVIVEEGRQADRGGRLAAAGDEPQRRALERPGRGDRPRRGAFGRTL